MRQLFAKFCEDCKYIDFDKSIRGDEVYVTCTRMDTCTRAYSEGRYDERNEWNERVLSLKVEPWRRKECEVER